MSDVYVSIPSSSGLGSNARFMAGQIPCGQSQSLLLQVSALTLRHVRNITIDQVSIPSSSGLGSNGLLMPVMSLSDSLNPFFFRSRL